MIDFIKTNEKNIDMFAKYGVDCPEKKIYTCVLCNRKVTCGESMSCRGDHLICNDCFEENFQNFDSAHSWICGDEEND